MRYDMIVHNGLSLFLFCMVMLSTLVQHSSSTDVNTAVNDSIPLCGNEIISEENKHILSARSSSIQSRTYLRARSGLVNDYVLDSKFVQVFRVLQIGGTAAAKLPSNADYLNNAFYTVTRFYQENSRGLLNLQFQIYDTFLTDSGYTKANCQTSASNTCGVSSYVYRPDLHIANDSYHYMYIYEDYCPCMGFRGLGQVLGDVTWINGPPAYAVVAHELGHNFGASHANYYLQEYGNYFSVMGSGVSSIDAHFTAVGKVQFKWISNENVKVLARKNKCVLNVNEYSGYANQCDDSCTKTNPCKVQLHAHDAEVDTSTIGYDSDKLYAIRVGSDEPDAALWVEYRSRYSQFKSGVWGIWSYESAYDPSVVSRYGPTQLLDYHVDTDSVNDMTQTLIPVGDVWVYDLDNVGLVLKVTSVDIAEAIADVEVYFADKIAADHNYQSSISKLNCGIEKNITLTKTTPYKLLYFSTWSEISIQLAYTIENCNPDELSAEYTGIYIYTTYPLQLELQSTLDPRVGASQYFPLGCSNKASDPWVKETINIVQKISPKRTSTFPPFVDYSPTNYILFFMNGEDMDVNSEYSISMATDESYGCYTPCEKISVSTTVTDLVHLVGEYSYSSSNDSFGNIQNEIMLDTNLVWGITGDKGKNVIQKSSIPTIIIKSPNLTHIQSPHLVDSWSDNVLVSCVARSAVLFDDPTNAPTPLVSGYDGYGDPDVGSNPNALPSLLKENENLPLIAAASGICAFVTIIALLSAIRRQIIKSNSSKKNSAAFMHQVTKLQTDILVPIPMKVDLKVDVEFNNSMRRYESEVLFTDTDELDSFKESKALFRHNHSESDMESIHENKSLYTKEDIPSVKEIIESVKSTSSTTALLAKSNSFMQDDNDHNKVETTTIKESLKKGWKSLRNLKIKSVKSRKREYLENARNIPSNKSKKILISSTKPYSSPNTYDQPEVSIPPTIVDEPNVFHQEFDNIKKGEYVCHMELHLKRKISYLTFAKTGTDKKETHNYRSTGRFKLASFYVHEKNHEAPFPPMKMKPGYRQYLGELRLSDQNDNDFFSAAASMLLRFFKYAKRFDDAIIETTNFSLPHSGGVHSFCTVLLTRNFDDSLQILTTNSRHLFRIKDIIVVGVIRTEDFTEINSHIRDISSKDLIAGLQCFIENISCTLVL